MKVETLDSIVVSICETARSRSSVPRDRTLSLLYSARLCVLALSLRDTARDVTSCHSRVMVVRERWYIFAKNLRPEYF
jgi:hypothetical protein